MALGKRTTAATDLLIGLWQLPMYCVSAMILRFPVL